MKKVGVKPCLYAEEFDTDAFECVAANWIECPRQIFDYNPDGSINIVVCELHMEKHGGGIDNEFC